jgi:transposase
MPRYRTAYPPEFRRQMVDLVRSGRTPEELALSSSRPHSRFPLG